jgi:hypothetical protein
VCVYVCVVSITDSTVTYQEIQKVSIEFSNENGLGVGDVENTLAVDLKGHCNRWTRTFKRNYCRYVRKIMEEIGT